MTVLSPVRPDQVDPVTVLGLPIEFILPVTLASLVLVSVVFMFCYALRGTQPTDRPEIIRAFTGIVRALGDVIRKILETLRRPAGSNLPPRA